MSNVDQQSSSSPVHPAQKLSAAARALLSDTVEALPLDGLREVDGHCFPLVITPRAGALTDREQALAWVSAHGD